MKLILRSIDRTASGREIVREREVGDLSADGAITIGRATTNALVLADLSVEQHHATLTASGQRLTMTAATRHSFLFEGGKHREVSFSPATGGEFMFGAYRLSFAPEGVDADGRPRLICTVTREERGEGARDAVRAFALSSALPGKRAMAWIALVGVLAVFLAIPVWSHLNRADQRPGAKGADAVMLDASWSPGKLSDAHHALERNCEACHVEPFVSVRDETCTACHKDIGDHAARPRLVSARGPMSRFDALQWKIAESFGKEGPEACVTCHSEHQGEGKMQPAAQQFCSDCHATLAARLTDTKLGNAGDFGASHPQFQPAVFTTLGSDAARRVSLTGQPQEASGLRFNHDEHLDRRGGVAKMALSLGRYRAPLECSDCHTPAPNGVGFEPIVMEDDCESCHSLVYDKVGGIFRTLRHGDVAQMRADLMAIDRVPRSAIASGRRRPGSVGDSSLGRSGARYPNFGPPVRNYTSIARALSPDGVCGECHYPASTAQGPGVMPVNLQTRYLTKGRFEHEDHAQETCASCHEAATSGAASDLLVPGIATCRTCHGGESDASADVPSSCAMCHSYHLPDGWTPGGKPPPARPRNRQAGSPAQIARISRAGR